MAPKTKSELVDAVLDRCVPDPRGERIVRSSLSCLDTNELATLIELLDATLSGGADDDLLKRGQLVLDKTAAFIKQHDPARKSMN